MKLMGKILLASVLLLGSYSTVFSQRTQFTATWRTADETARNFKKLLIVGMSRDVSARSTVEDEVVYYMRLKGVNAISGSDFLPADRSQVPKEKAALQKLLKDEGFDGILAISLKDIQKETKYVQGSNYYAPATFYGGYYGSFYSYYPNMYSQVYMPGYYVNSETIYLETNLFMVDSGDLIWSAQSDTHNKDDVDAIAHSYARGLVSYVLKKKIIQRNNKK